MERIVSGTTTERIVRRGIFAAMLLGYSAWSAWDAYVAYPKLNVADFVRSIGAQPPGDIRIDDHLTRSAAEEMKPALLNMSDEQAKEKLGAPALIHENAWYYFGPGMRLELKLSFGRVVSAEPVNARKTEVDLFWQKVIAVVTGLVGLVGLAQFISAVMTRVELSDKGLWIRGRKPVPLNAIKDIDAERYMKTGFLDLVCEMNGRTSRVRLDNYVIREFRPIVSKICEHCGLTNPLPPRPEEPASDNPNAVAVDAARHPHEAHDEQE